jgi:hypothetical protein
MVTLTAVEVIAGPGTVCRRAGNILVFGADVPVALAASLVDSVERAAAASTPGWKVVQDIRELLVATNPAGAGTLAAAVSNAGGFTVIVNGTAVATNERSQILDGAQAEPFAEAQFDVRGYLLVRTAPIAPTTGAQTVPYDLRDGTVPGSGCRLHVTPPPAVQATPSEPGKVVLIDLSSPPSEARIPLPIAGEPGRAPAGAGGGAAQHDPAPAPVHAFPLPSHALVQGLHCVRGHFNRLDAYYCEICGLGMVQQTRVVVTGPRPSLGVLVLDDGTSYALDTDYLVGRSPGAPDEVAGRAVRPLRIDDTRASRQHARISLEEWDVMITDLGSVNGTFVLNPRDSQWTRLVMNQPARLEPGGRVAIGGTGIVFEALRRT